MTKWERQRAQEKKKAKKAAIERRANLRQIVKLLANLVTPMRENTTWQKERVKVLRRALDVLAGEAASA